MSEKDYCPIVFCYRSSVVHRLSTRAWSTFMTLAAYVALFSAGFALIGCALSALFSFRSSQLVKRMRSTASMLGELTEIRDYMAKMDRWAKRINAREVMQERRSADGPGSSRRPASTNDKDELRRRVGLVGKTAPRHNED